jgi:hypothetical protein
LEIRFPRFDYDGVAASLGLRETEDFVRLYMAPGTQHCYEGPGPSFFGQVDLSALGPAAQQFSTDTDPQHNISSALERWAEEGIAPGPIVATKYVNDLDPSQGVKMTDAVQFARRDHVANSVELVDAARVIERGAAASVHHIGTGKGDRAHWVAGVSGVIEVRAPDVGIQRPRTDCPIGGGERSHGGKLALQRADQAECVVSLDGRRAEGRGVLPGHHARGVPHVIKLDEFSLARDAAVHRGKHETVDEGVPISGCDREAAAIVGSHRVGVDPDGAGNSFETSDGPGTQ